jgi:hypothetical protein
MKDLRHARWVTAGLLAVALAAGAGVRARGQSPNQTPTTVESQDPDQAKTPLPLNPAAPAVVNHRLILKDGSYQIVKQYQVAGDRVRYLSAERGEWEELPAALVDWEATRKWDRDHAAPQPETDQVSPAMKEAEAIDKEESAERTEQTARMPEVAKELNLPDEDGVFALDTFHGTPELVELKTSELNMRTKNRHGVSTLNPQSLARANLELDGEHARVHLHVNDPVIYFSLNVQEESEPVLASPMTVDTRSMKPAVNVTHGAHSAASKFALVGLDERNTVRLVGALTVSGDGSAVAGDDVIPATVDELPGKHWLRVTPRNKLLIGEYALVEIISDTQVNQQVWDFRVDPATGDNVGSLTPILAQ